MRRLREEKTLSEQGLNRRAFIRAAAGSLVVAGAALGSACDDKPDIVGSTSGGKLTDRRAPLFFSEDFATDRHGWGDAWLNVRYETGWWVADGAGVCDVPAGVPKALAPGKGHTQYMTQPVVHTGAAADGVHLEARILLDGDVEAGVIACASFDECYALLVRPGGAILCRYGVTDRAVLGTIHVATDDWVDLLLVAERGALLAGAGDKSGLHTVDVDDRDALGPGLVGTLVNPLSDTHGGRARFKTFRARSEKTIAPPPPAFTHRFAGGVVADGDGYRARVTARTVVPSAVAFEVSRNADFSDSALTHAGAPEGKLGAVHSWLDGLSEGTKYYWRPVAVAADRTTPGPTATFRTPPPSGAGVTFAYASCTSGRVTEYPSFERMKSYDPDFLVHSGDWGYADLTSTARRADHFQARWIRQLRAPEIAALLDDAPLVFWQDDHDYASDNGWSQTCKQYAVTAFDELHANPLDDFFDLRWGDVHLWCLDCRLHATDPEAPDDANKSRIGFEQKAWLKDGMASSDAPVKIVASAMVFRNKDPDDPGWQSVYTHERDELLDFFSKVDGTVAIMSGDSHGQRLIHHFEFGDLWEINSAGTDFPHGGQGNYDPEHTVVNISHRSGFAIATLDPAGPDRKLTIKSIATDDGSTLFQRTFPVA